MHPLTLTLIAPAKQCNQKCPNCAIALSKEPANVFDLTPQDYVKFIMDFYEAELPIGIVSFQGYEVTLPQSFPYLEAVFDTFDPLGVNLGFVTNGMLLHRYAKNLKKYKNILRILVSIDGSDDQTNDHLRGLKGALKVTKNSLKKFLSVSPEYRKKIFIGSVIYGDQNKESLLAMPKLIKEMGLSNWILSHELVKNSEKGGLKIKEIRKDIMFACQESARQEGINVLISDEFGYINSEGQRGMNVMQLQEEGSIFRLLPNGEVRWGKESIDEKDTKYKKWSYNQNVLDFIYQSKILAA